MQSACSILLIGGIAHCRKEWESFAQFATLKVCLKHPEMVDVDGEKTDSNSGISNRN